MSRGLGAAKHPTMDGNPSATKNDLAQSVSHAEVRNLVLGDGKGSYYAW